MSEGNSNRNELWRAIQATYTPGISYDEHSERAAARAMASFGRAHYSNLVKPSKVRRLETLEHEYIQRVRAMSDVTHLPETHADYQRALHDLEDVSGRVESLLLEGVPAKSARAAAKRLAEYQNARANIGGNVNIATSVLHGFPELTDPKWETRVGLLVNGIKADTMQEHAIRAVESLVKGVSMRTTNVSPDALRKFKAYDLTLVRAAGRLMRASSRAEIQKAEMDLNIERAKLAHWTGAQEFVHPINLKAAFARAAVLAVKAYWQTRNN